MLGLALLGLVAGYALILAAAFGLQRRLIYQPVRLEREPALAGGAALVRFRAPDGPLVSGLYAAPQDAAAPIALIFHGNAGNLVSWRPVLDRWVERGAGALLVDPRGYGVSEGEPSEEGLLADGRAALAWLAAQGIAPARVIVHGISIGSGIAVPLAAEASVRALVLESAFTNLVEVAQRAFPLLPCGLLLRDRFDNAALAPSVRCPVILFHGAADSLVALELGRRLAALFPTQAAFHVAPGLGHNEVALWEGLEPALAAFVAGLR